MYETRCVGASCYFLEVADQLGNRVNEVTVCGVERVEVVAVCLVLVSELNRDGQSVLSGGVLNKCVESINSELVGWLCGSLLYCSRCGCRSSRSCV